MGTVYVVQESRRYHCPKCDSTYSNKLKDRFGFKCTSCGHEYEHGVSKPVKSVSEAAIYGKLEVLIEQNNVGVAIAPVIRELKQKLINFSDDDYLLPIGDPVVIGLATTIAARSNRGHVKMLRWDRQTRQYIKVEAKV